MMCGSRQRGGAIVNLDHVEAWMDGYVLAWASNDPEQIGALFSEDLDATSPWQFKNFRVA